MSQPEIEVVANLQALVEETAARIIAEGQRAIRERGRFAIALSGGNTPRPVYERLTRSPYDSALDWTKVQIFFGDERCVPPDSDQSNYRMAREAMLSRLLIPQSSVFRIRGEIDPQTAAMEYGQLLKQQFDDGGLDLILLGMGPDGHTASLFPHTEALQESKHRCVANYVEKFKSWRITMTAPFINRARAVIFLVSGADKTEAINAVLHGPGNPERLPAQLIRPASGKLTWIIDSAAAGAP